MDDPWGSSPWADEEEDIVNPSVVPVVSKATNHTTATESPWGQEADENFGGWAALPAEHDLTRDASARGIGTWDQEDGKQASAEDTAEVDNISQPGWFRRDIRGKVSSQIPQVMTTLERQPSPDPWGTDACASDRKDKNIAAENTLSAIRDYEVEAESKVFDEGVATGSVQSDKDARSKSQQNSDVNQKANSSTEDTVVAPTPLEPADDLHLPDTRPSTSPSDSSHGDERPAESPRTSVDEEPKRPGLEREGSSKVMVLVKQFEGLSYKGSDSEATSSDDRAAQEEEIHEDDFGDFEDGDDGQLGELQSVQSNAEIVKMLPPASTQDKAAAKSLPKMGTVVAPVPFNVDHDLINRIFPQDLVFEKTAIPVHDKDLPDTEFSREFSLDQRKTWYRISRYGTLRKHNTGNDDNYARVAWPTSKTRGDTLKIVGRWMEEDRISRGVVLGGSNRLGSLFGWRDTSGLPGDRTSHLGKEAKQLARHSAPPAPRISRSPPPNINSQSKIHHPERDSNKLKTASSATTVHMEPVFAAQFSWSSSQPLTPQTATLAATTSNNATPAPVPATAPSPNQFTPPTDWAPKLAESYPQRTPADAYRLGGQTSLPRALDDVPSTSFSPQPDPESLPPTSASPVLQPSSSQPRPMSMYDFEGQAELPASFRFPPAQTSPLPSPLHQPARWQSQSPAVGDPFPDFASSPESTILAADAAFRPALIVRTATIPVVPSTTDDDDEWGDMVSIQAQPPPPSTPSPSRQQPRPQSLLNPISTTDLDSMFGPSRGHRQTLSMSEEIAIPGKAESILGSPALHSPVRRTPRTSVSSIRSLNSVKGDPWGTADLLALDNPAPPLVRMSSTSTRPRRPSRLSMGSTSAPTNVPALSHLPSIMSPPPQISPVASPAPRAASPLRKQHQSHWPNEELEQDRVVISIVQGLPDLSYMLRR